MSWKRNTGVTPPTWNTKSVPIVLVLIRKPHDVSHLMEHPRVIVHRPVSTPPLTKCLPATIAWRFHVDVSIRKVIAVRCRGEKEIVFRIGFDNKAKVDRALASLMPRVIIEVAE